ncbi:TRAP transporter small permease [Halomonas daqiaonensis]|uniref:TRAP transporter small permease protein n=1 Tax=Halomonas daqiaonensis TaxID=650850 RepID=A0A1H7RZZ1_9GAMM|nr:TRAP transporter small permease [Halomonas daqiaonensis]SEL65880.1 TRAP-type C4-dicarboxylate transport system, small permease component [Halomonas daqiaonensis]
MLRILSLLIARTAYGVFLLGVFGGVVMTGLIFVSTLMRYLGGSPLRFSDELAGLLFLSLTFLCLPYVLDKGRHMRIEIIRNIVPGPMARIMDVISTLTLVAFCMAFAYEAWDFMGFSYSISSRADISGILLWPWMAIMPFSMLLCLLVQFRHGIRQPMADQTLEKDVPL